MTDYSTPTFYDWLNQAAEKNKEEEDLIGAGFIILLFIILAVSTIVAAGLWSQALALFAGIWIAKSWKL